MVFLYYYPIILTSIGVGIHLFGTLGLFQVEVPRLWHVLMLIVDFLVVVGLARKTVWGYRLALLLYIQQSIMQPYWAWQAYLQGLGLFQLLVTSPLVIVALIILIFRKKLFIKNIWYSAFAKDLT